VAACNIKVAGSILVSVVWSGDWEFSSNSSSSKAAAGKPPLHVTTFLNYFKSQRLIIHTSTLRRTLKCTEIDALKTKYSFLFEVGSSCLYDVHPQKGTVIFLDLFSAIIGRI
jgi:hypothetical protein